MAPPDAAADALFIEELRSARGTLPLALWRRLAWMCASSIAVAVFFYIGVMSGTTTLPVAINLMMNWVTGADDFRLGALYVLAIAGAVYVSCISSQFFELACFRIGSRARDAMSILAFEKMARLRRADAGTHASPGELHTLTAVDAVALEGLCAGLIATFLIPVEMAVLLGLLWMLMQWAMLAGIAVFLLCLGAAFLVGRHMQVGGRAGRPRPAGKLGHAMAPSPPQSLTEARAVVSEARGRLTYELLASSLAVKLRAWEPLFESRILARRAAESRITRRIGLMQVRAQEREEGE